MKLWKLSLLAAEGVFSLAIAWAGEQAEVRTGTMVATLNDMLIVRAAGEEVPHTERVSSQSTITRNGSPVRLADLRAGDQLMTTTGGDCCVVRIEATSNEVLETHVIASTAGSRLSSN